MDWTTDRPTKPGYYLRVNAGHGVTMHRIDKRGKWTKPCPTLLRSFVILLDTLSELPSRKSPAPISKKSSTKPYDPPHWSTDLLLDPAYRICGQSTAFPLIPSLSCLRARCQRVAGRYRDLCRLGPDPKALFLVRQSGLAGRALQPYTLTIC